MRRTRPEPRPAVTLAEACAMIADRLEAAARSARVVAQGATDRVGLLQDAELQADLAVRLLGLALEELCTAAAAA